MTKNIILCADGTGNKGGYTPDSNVYKIYNAIEIHDSNTSQYTYYDNGVGTSSNKYWRAISGAFGIGIKQNIIDLYTFLAMHYEPGDRVYLFGFSRGAATIRAFCGFIATTGLVNGKHLSDEKLTQYTCDAFKAYKNHKKNPQAAQSFARHSNSHNIIDIHFVGVWDTVSALGFPTRTDKTSASLFILDLVFMGLEKVLDVFWPHLFYRYELTPNIQHAFHALAIDDERTAFWPMVWDETTNQAKEVEQVWFAGMHSNVGGGYERAGMANVTLHWMMLRAQKYGLDFKDNKVSETYDDSNIHGRLYNSRDGLAVYYRYHPRNIAKLCKNKLKGDINIHCSTLERMKKRTANYAPVMLPDKFNIVQSPLNADQFTVDVKDQPEHSVLRRIINKSIASRKRLYGHFIDISLLLGIYVWHLSNTKIATNNNEAQSLLDMLSNTSTTVLFDRAINDHPIQLGIFGIFAISIYYLRSHYRNKTHRAAEKIRQIFIEKISALKTEK